MTSFVTSLSNLFKRWFHKRNIIIISERKVKHVPISGGLQFITLALTLTSICWASYSTGSFIAARSALKQQGQALRSVTNAHIENSFSTVYQPQVSENSEPINTTPAAALSGMDNAKLIARITLLENKVDELKHTNETIVQSVHDKTASHLDTLKDVIKQTGLNLSQLKKEYSNEDASKAKSESKTSAQGGPYIPDETPNMSSEVKEMLSGLDDLALMSRIVGNLPLATPIQNAEEQSTFGHRIDPFNGHLAFHSGLDLSGPIGSKIYSTADGKVIAAGRNGGYGNDIDIDHGYGITTRYAHLSEILVHEGQLIKKGDVIGIQGSTGRSTGPHLHYEVRYHDQAMNPKNFLEAGQYVSQE